MYTRNDRVPEDPRRLGRWGVQALAIAGTLCGMLAMPGIASAQAVDAVNLHYIQRPPYMVVVGDTLTGLTGGPAHQAFLNAKIPVVLKETPFARQLRYVEVNSGQDCMIGMFKKPERELFAKYTKPIYQDQPQVILTAADNAGKFANHHSLGDVLGDKSLTLLTKLAYSYGASVDALLDKYQPTRITTADENLQMIRAIRMKLSDYMFIAPEEASVAIQAAGFEPKDFKQIKFGNMPDGEYRHLMCSKNVPDAVIQRLNAVIRLKK